MSFRKQDKVGVRGINKSTFERAWISEDVYLPAFGDPPDPNTGLPPGAPQCGIGVRSGRKIGINNECFHGAIT